MAERMGDPCAADFSTSHFTTYRADRLAGKYNREKIGSGRKKGEEAKPVSANTLNHELAYLRAVFNELERLGEWQGDNPLGKMRALKFDETEMAYLSAAQIPPLLASLDSSSKAAGLIARICLSTGARWSEAEGLKPNQVRDKHPLHSHEVLKKSSCANLRQLGQFAQRGAAFPCELQKIREVGRCDRAGAAGGAIDSRSASYLRESLHDEWRRYSYIAACPGTFIPGDDDALCPLQSGTPGGSG